MRGPGSEGAGVRGQSEGARVRGPGSETIGARE